MAPRSAIRLAVIQGSVRPDNYTGKAVAVVLDELGRHERVSVDLIDPATLSLPLPGSGADSADAKTMQETVSAATGIIFSTPEYHGSFSSVVKLIIDNLGFPSVISGKPVALLGVAAGRIGAVKALEHLRSVCSHVGALVLPGPISIANCRSAFDADGRVKDPATDKQIRQVPQSLLKYIRRHVCPAMSFEAMVREEAGV